AQRVSRLTSRHQESRQQGRAFQKKLFSAAGHPISSFWKYLLCYYSKSGFGWQDGIRFFPFVRNPFFPLFICFLL
ncbi:MAG TPA: hypothetical protein PLU82_06145, partial [Oscillospiraceae bacterium]|nr:hypothetical protein [Oscillospiraceae bacterium]